MSKKRARTESRRISAINFFGVLSKHGDPKAWHLFPFVLLDFIWIFSIFSL